MCEKKIIDKVAGEPPEVQEEDDFDESKRPSLARIMQMTRSRPWAKKARRKK